ncbi:hypothetical protein PT974_03125 [Cladobotryum mycophilum]|uniref:MOSC domain-containing protein n=1 Tax=Cladobotryum mycophilum TaxID=491253 RepID=A0ABR0SS27_9HYPO
MAEVTAEGFRFDRQYILIKALQAHDTSAHIAEHITIKTNFRLSLFQPSIDQDWSTLMIRHTLAQPESSITIPLTPSPLSCLESQSYQVNIFGTTATGVDMGNDVAEFFSNHLGMAVRLLFIGGNGRREIPGTAFSSSRHTFSMHEARADFPHQRIRFADMAPFLVTSSASEENTKLRLPESQRNEDVLLRFRPNIHLDVGETAPFDEDNWRELVISNGDGGARQKAIIRCFFRTHRCLSLNVDIETGTMAPRNRQVYGLLAADRRVNKTFPRTYHFALYNSKPYHLFTVHLSADKPVFGQYAFAAPTGAILCVGDEVRLTHRTTD